MDRPIEEKRDDPIRLCAKYRVRRLELFRSALTHRFDSQTSDLDFLVEFLPLQPERCSMRLESRNLLEEQLAEAARLTKVIRENLRKLEHG